VKFTFSIFFRLGTRYAALNAHHKSTSNIQNIVTAFDTL